MKKILCIITVVLAAVTGIKAQTFPAGYAGDWKGKLNIYSPGVKTVGEIDMELRIHPTATPAVWEWEISYLTKGKAPDVRKYLLIANDSARGKYTVDEKNGILIEGRLINNMFITRFAVGGTLLLITYQLEGDKIIFEVLSGPADKTIETGNNPEESIPLVTVYSVTNYQKAELEKK